MLDVPEYVKRIRLRESFRQIYALVSLARTINFFIHPVYPYKDSAFKFAFEIAHN